MLPEDIMVSDSQVDLQSLK